MQEDNHDGDVDHTEENGEGEAFHYDIGYAAQLEEALGLDEDKDEENELFLYEGEDTCQQPLTSYDEQLRSVLMEADDAESWSTDGREDDNESPEVRVQYSKIPPKTHTIILVSFVSANHTLILQLCAQY